MVGRCWPVKSGWGLAFWIRTGPYGSGWPLWLGGFGLVDRSFVLMERGRLVRKGVGLSDWCWPIWFESATVALGGFALVGC